MQIQSKDTAQQTAKPGYVYVYGERATHGKGQACFAGGAGAFATR